MLFIRHLPGYVCVRLIIMHILLSCMRVNSVSPTGDVHSLMHLRVEFVLKDVQIIGGSNGDDVLRRVPGRVEDLLGEVQAVHADVVFPPLPSGRADPPGFQDGSGLAALPRGLQGHVAFGVAVKHAKEVVVCSCHNHTAWKQMRGLTSQQYCSNIQNIIQVLLIH